VTALSSYGLRSRWELETVRAQLGFLVPIQFLLSAALAVGLGFLVPDIDTETAKYLSTGAPTIALMTIGLAVIPQVFVQRKQSGEQEFYRSLPISPTIDLAATMTVPVLTALPGSLLSLVVASWYFDFKLDPSPLALVAMLLVALTGTAVGGMIGTVATHPQVSNLLSNVLLFFVMLFSPINFPAERLPDWLQTVHQVLPIESLATLVRNTLTGVSTSMGDWALATVWAAGAFAVSAAVAGRRE